MTTVTVIFPSRFQSGNGTRRYNESILNLLPNTSINVLNCQTLSSSAVNGNSSTVVNGKENGTKNTSSDGTDTDGTGTTSEGSVASSGSADEEDYSMYSSVKDADRGIYQTTITMYQHRKAIYYSKNVYSCPAGYIQNGAKCYKTTTGAIIDASPIYSGERTITTDAVVNGGGSHIEYADPIKTRTGIKIVHFFKF